MGTVLRLHQEADNSITDWTGGENRMYGPDVIEQIVDPSGATAKKEITSIPSPFARIDLAKNAFEIVSSKLEGNTIYHKMVSDCLDIGEILFNYDMFSKDVKIIKWDKKSEIQKLEDSEDEVKQILGRTLRMYLEQDKETYNFDKMDAFFLLGYQGRGCKGSIDIIGATSPRTLFFSSANDLSYLSEYLKAPGKDKPFDDEYTPLYKRDFEYQKFLYALVESVGSQNFAKLFPELNKYMKESLRHLNDAQKDELRSMDNTSVDKFPELSINGDDVEVLGIKLHKGKGIGLEELQSDFRIKSTKCSGKKPLVLPVVAGNKYGTLKYVTDNWQDDYHAPYEDRKKVEERVLPHTAAKYPYLTISDFLTPTILNMPFDLADNYFDGNITDKRKSFLLPLTEKFFDYFTPEELMNTMLGGKPMIEMSPLPAGGINVTLRIPVQGNAYVEYLRTYYNTSSPNIKDNEGNVVECRFGLGVMPLVDLKKSLAAPFYRIAFFSKDRGCSLRFASDDVVRVKSHVVRREFDNTKDICSVESYVLENVFDRIYVDSSTVSNVIVPIFKKVGSTTKYTFAVDFGTTNTHIEYSTDGSNRSQAFEITKEEIQMARMHKGYKEDKDIQYAFEDAFVPQTIGADGSDYLFPMRTVFAENDKIDYKKQTDSLADGNIPFRYEKAAVPRYNKIKTDIKWSNKEVDRVRLYLDNLFLLMRNKVLINGGDLGSTKVIWFYPVSMTRARVEQFTLIWKELYVKYFGPAVDKNLVQVSESVAPYNYYAIRGAKLNVVTIDIGGGTTDVYVVQDKKPVMLSSFRFAANAIFGDGYNDVPEDNGFVRTFSKTIYDTLVSNAPTTSDLLDAYALIKKTDVSQDIAAFFFSLASNKTIRDNNIPLDFLGSLSRNDKMKYIFIIFYGAILYYVANMMKAKGLELPHTLAFSGNGSKTLHVISPSNDTIADFATKIFERVYGTRYSGTNLEVKIDDEPKLATCKGGIAYNQDLEFDDVNNLKTSLLGVDSSTFVNGVTYKQLQSNDQIVEGVAKAVEEFIDFLFEINNENKSYFANVLGVDAPLAKEVQEICKSNLLINTKMGRDAMIEEIQSWNADIDSEVEETAFFYPIVPMLSKLASKIADKD